MDKATYTNLLKFTRSLSVQDYPYSDEFTSYAGDFFSEDDVCRLFGRIILERSRENRLIPVVKGKVREAAVQEAKTKLTGLTGQQKFFVTALYFLYCSDPNTGQIVPELEWHVKYAADVLDVSAGDLADIQLFFSQGKPYADRPMSSYLVPAGDNQLIKASGLNMHFCLNTENEIFYLKYFKNQDVFLTRRFHCYRANNAIDRAVTLKEINILNKSNSHQFIGSHFSYKELVASVVSFFPLQTVRSSAAENVPMICLDPVLGKVVIEGNSSPLSPLKYFQPVYDWMKLYGELGGEHLEVHLRFEYFNSYTSKFILNFTNMCLQLAQGGKSINFCWYFNSDDEETFEFGQHLSKVAGKKFPVKLIKDKRAIPA